MSKQITRENLINCMVEESLINTNIAEQWIGASRPTRNDLRQLMENIQRKQDEKGIINQMSYSSFCEYHINKAYSNYLWSHTLLMSAMVRPFDSNSWAMVTTSYTKKEQTELFNDLLKDIKANNYDDSRYYELILFAKKSISLGYLWQLIRFEELCEHAWGYYTPKNYAYITDLLFQGSNNEIFKESYIRMLEDSKSNFKSTEENDDLLMKKSINNQRYIDLQDSLPFYRLDKINWQIKRDKQYDAFASQFCKYEGIKQMKFNTLKKYCFNSLKKAAKIGLNKKNKKS